jgi:hypothetical protein
MAKKKHFVYLYQETGGDNKGTLRLALVQDDPSDIAVPVESRELVTLQGLYALAPDVFRRMMNQVVGAAFEAGVRQGASEERSERVDYVS